MADNLTTTTTVSTIPNATVIATDDASGVHYQKIKLVDGTDGATTVIPAGGGVEAAALRVTVASDSTGVLSVDDNGGNLSIDDGGNSITVDNATISVVGTGTEATAQRVTIATDSTGVLSVDDNGSSLTVDGTVTAAQGTAANLNMTEASAAAIKTAVEVMDDWDESDRAKVNPIAGQAGVQGASGTVTALTQRVVLATDVALPAGTNAIGKLAANSGVDIGDVDVASIAAGDNNIGNVDIASGPTGASALQAQGAAAADATVAGNPVAIGGRSNDAVPTEVSADGEAVWAWMLRNGAQVVAGPPHLGLIGDPYTLLHETVQTTTTQTGSDILTVNSGKKLVITSLQIQAGGTTAGTVQVWFGATADTTYSRGTDRAIFDGEFAPSATLKPGVFLAPPTPWIGAADEELHLTTSAAINPLTVTVWYYEV